MNTSYPTSTSHGFTLPPQGVSMSGSWSDAVGAAAVRTPVTAGVTTVAADTPRRVVDVAPVCAPTRIADAFVLKGAFPGTSSWSPPI